MSSRAPRKRGWEKPYAPDQMIALVLHPLLTVYFYVLSGLSMPRHLLASTLVPYAILGVLVLYLWLWVELVDPSTEGGIILPCKGKAQEGSQYCPSCRKAVRGFDHHCTWLNTCIGTKNYLQFYLLTLVGLLHYTLQTVVGVLALTIWIDDDQLADAFGSVMAGRALWGSQSALAFWIALSFGSLCGFHSFLFVVGMGTYEWVMDGQRKRAAKRAAKAAEARTTRRRETTPPQSAPNASFGLGTAMDVDSPAEMA
ncbi:unnamed protein product [Chrysoparadoxa australica]